ncbi:MAG: hypothetical protein IPO89_01360 [Actinomycetales bacterium]|nr:hypothetical protein [Candidatus Lutibacillus vidarii]
MHVHEDGPPVHRLGQRADDRRHRIGRRGGGDDPAVGVEGGIQQPFVLLPHRLPEAAGDGEEGDLVRDDE